jgi:type VI secretion system protein ImpF
MARVEYDVSLVPSILDRLFDDRPDVSQEPPHDRFQTVSALKQAVTRDLQALLNTRRELLEELPADFAEAGRSILAYGLPDFTSFSLRSDRDRSRIRRAVEQAIAWFEPRLGRVRVNIEAPGKHDQALRFRIEALLKIDPAPEPVTFDAMLRLDTHEYILRGSE